MGKLAANGILTRDDLLVELKINSQTLAKLEREHDFPGRKLGKKIVLYDVALIKRWIAKKAA